MKKYFIIPFLLILISAGLKAQSNHLTNGSSKTWTISGLLIGGERYNDVDSSCVYQIQITFTSGGTYNIFKPCSIDPPESGNYTITGDQLSFGGYTVTINSQTSSFLETSFISPVDGTSPTQTVEVITRYTN